MARIWMTIDIKTMMLKMKVDIHVFSAVEKNIF